MNRRVLYKKYNTHQLPYYQSYICVLFIDFMYMYASVFPQHEKYFTEIVLEAWLHCFKKRYFAFCLVGFFWSDMTELVCPRYLCYELLFFLFLKLFT